MNKSNRLGMMRAAALAALAAAPALAGTNATWTGPSTGSPGWSAPENWNSNPMVPSFPGDSALFADIDNAAGNLAVGLQGAFISLGSLSFTASSSAFFPRNVTLSAGGGGLTFDNNGALATLAATIPGSGGGALTLDVPVTLNGNLAINASYGPYRTLSINGSMYESNGDRTLTINGTAGELVSFGDYVSVSTIAVNSATMRLTNRDAWPYIKSLSINAGSTLEAPASLLTSFSVGYNLTVADGAMIVSDRFEPYNVPGNLGSTPRFVFGIYTDSVTGRTVHNPPGSYTLPVPQTIQVGAGSYGPWKGIGADTRSTSDNPRQHYFGHPGDTIEAQGAFEIRNTHAVRLDQYGLPTSGALSVSARITGNAGTINLTGPGTTIVTHAGNDVIGTWRVNDGGALRLDVFGDTEAGNTQAALGNAGNDLVLNNGTLAMRAAGRSQEAVLDPGRTVTIDAGFGTLYFDYGTNGFTAGYDPLKTSRFAWQSCIEPDGTYNSDRYGTPSPTPVIEEKTVGKLTIGAGQLLGAGTLTKDGRGSVVLGGANATFAGGVNIAQGTLHAERVDSLGAANSSPITIADGAVHTTGFPPTAAYLARVKGQGTYGIGGSYAGNIDLSASDVWLHTSLDASYNVTVSNVTPNAAAGYKFGGAGGVLFVTQGLAGKNVTLRGPGITILAADNTGVGAIDFSQGGLGIGHPKALGTGTVVSLAGTTDPFADPPDELIFANGLDANSAGRGYTVELAGGNVGFAGDTTISSLAQLGVMKATTGTQVLGVGATGDYGALRLNAAVGTNPSGRPIRIVKRGGSTLDLTGNAAGNTNTGGMYVYSGTLRFDKAAQLGAASNQVLLYDGATLRAAAEGIVASNTFNISRPTGRLEAVGAEATVDVPAGTLTFSGDFRIVGTGNLGQRLRKTGAGTLSFTGMPATKGSTHAFGLTLEEGTVEINRLPYYSATGSGPALFNGGDLHCTAETGATGLRADADYGFWGMRVLSGKTSTVRIDAGGLFKMIGAINNPTNRFDGTLIIEGANDTGGGWGEFYLTNTAGGMGWAPDSVGAIELRSGLLTADYGAKERLPSNPAFVFRLLGGRINSNTNAINGLVHLDGVEVVNLTLAGQGDTFWDASLTKTGSGTFALNRAGGANRIAAGVQLTIQAGGTVSAGGSIDPFVDTATSARMPVINDGTLRIAAGEKHPGALAGTGTTIVETDAALRIDGPITQKNLTVKGIVEAGPILADGTVKVGDGNYNTKMTADYVRDCDLVVGNGYDTAMLTLRPNGTDAATSVVRSLAIPASYDYFYATLDVNDNALIVQGAGATELAKINAMAASGRNRGYDGLWSGTGIRSSALGALDDPMLALAVVLNDNGAGLPILDWWAGQAVGVGDVIVAMAGIADTNLDRIIDGDDYLAIDRGFLGGAPAVYSQGDFDYSGYIDGDDYWAIDDAFLRQPAPGLAGSAVPEPGTLVALAGMGLLLRRRVPAKQ